MWISGSKTADRWYVWIRSDAVLFLLPSAHQITADSNQGDLYHLQALRQDPGDGGVSRNKPVEGFGRGPYLMAEHHPDTCGVDGSRLEAGERGVLDAQWLDLISHGGWVTPPLPCHWTYCESPLRQGVRGDFGSVHNTPSPHAFSPHNALVLSCIMSEPRSRC